MLAVRALGRGRRAGPRAFAAAKLPLAVLAALIALAVAASGASAAGVTGAAFTTVNEFKDGAGHCKNGNPAVNCNIYDGKEFVWLNGGPSVAYVGDGTYFFAVLEPGGQPDPNDGGAKNLSDDFDAYTDRTFSVSGGTVAYGGSHDFDSNKIRLAPYADTTNPGGVYIMAICSLANGYPVKPSSCKYDAFKVREAGNQNAAPLVVTKDAAGNFDNAFAWTITKDADKTLVKQIGGNATFTYTVKVSHDGGTVDNVTVNGTITVFNSNTAPVTGVDVTDNLSDGTVCTVTGGSAATIAGASFADFPYECELSDLPAEPLDNTATVTWPEQTLDPDGALATGSADFTFENIEFAENKIDECVDVTDSYKGPLGSACVGDANPTSFSYQRTVPVPQFNCVSYDNTATFTTRDTATTGSASQTVTVCGPARTGALTMGFWQNPNGQGIIKNGASTAGVCNSGTWLRSYAPFQDLSATAKCADVAAYVAKIIKAADASGASMNAMLKAQMLATALDVYFSDAGLGGNKIAAPAPIGAVRIDLTKICKNIGTCTIFENVSSAFGGATSLTVSQMLACAAGKSNVGGTTWYGNAKTTQELAKDAFDAINNQVAFSP
jgi:hypothetical protein